MVPVVLTSTAGIFYSTNFCIRHILSGLISYPNSKNIFPLPNEVTFLKYKAENYKLTKGLLMGSKLTLLFILAVTLMVPLYAGAADAVKKEAKPVRHYTELDLTRGQERKLRELHKSMKYINKEHWRRTAALEIKVNEELLKSKTSSRKLSKYYEKLDALNEKNAKLVAAHEKRAEKIMGEKYCPQFQNAKKRPHRAGAAKVRRVPPSIHVRKLGPMNWGHFPKDGSPVFLRGYHHPALIQKR